ncbi:MAG: ribonuclease E inhibitor RraB [Erysipelotrichaceae bacterium]|nr:ribonuclease E inhibitor RraB [Erysipelotrichaceae bacterium]
MKKLLSFIAVTVTAATAVAAGAYFVKKLEQEKDEEVKLIEIINEDESEKKTSVEEESESKEELNEESSFEELVKEEIAEEIAPEEPVEVVEEVIEEQPVEEETVVEEVIEEQPVEEETAIEEVIEEQPVEEETVVEEVIEEQPVEEETVVEEVIEEQPVEEETVVEEEIEEQPVEEETGVEEVIEEQPVEEVIEEQPVEEVDPYHLLSERKKNAICNQINVMIESMEEFEEVGLQHYIVFPNPEDTEAFLVEVEDAGYDIFVEENGQEVNLIKNSQLEREGLEKEILSLAQLAAEFTGAYKGWAVKIDE